MQTHRMGRFLQALTVDKLVGLRGCRRWTDPTALAAFLRSRSRRGILIHMKGPFERLKYDLRRVWECPLCHHRQATDGSQTTQVCSCQADKPRPVNMKMIHDGCRRRTVGKTAAAEHG